jgi:hypothetical protein
MKLCLRTYEIPPWAKKLHSEIYTSADCDFLNASMYMRRSLDHVIAGPEKFQ